MENADWACIINVEMKKTTGQYYLTFKRVKIRYRHSTDMGYFNHPFDNNNRMRLLDDIGLDHSLSEDSLASDFEGVNLNVKGRRNATEREVVKSDDFFDFGTSLNKNK